jgi:hypothetical protein
MTLLTIIAHGVPGGFALGESVTSRNVAPLGGWISDHFEQSAWGSRILGCNAAADSTQRIGRCSIGQASPLTDYALSHQGYDLLRTLACAARQKVEAPLQALPVKYIKLGLAMTCRRVYPNGSQELFQAGVTTESDVPPRG